MLVDLPSNSAVIPFIRSIPINHTGLIVHRIKGPSLAFISRNHSSHNSFQFYRQITMGTAAVVHCSICLDEEELVVFNCSNYTCSYQLCGSCVRDAFKDGSGNNSSVCQQCRTPSDMDMISALCGPGAIKAVERKIRSAIEFELQAETIKKDAAKKELAETNTRAREIFNELTDEINLKCPRCKMVFTDYDGCNALSCGVSACRAAFCAICLEDCGADAHSHVRTRHGNLFDKGAFESSKVVRAKRIVASKMDGLAGESFELRQLVQNHIDKAKLLDEKDGANSTQSRATRFLQDARGSLLRTTKNDRLSLLSNPEDYQPGRARLSRQDISPRCAVPDQFRVTMTSRGQDIYSLTLEHNDGVKWIRVSLKDVAKELQDIPKVDALTNLVQSINCAVIAFEDHRTLYQTRRTQAPKQRQLSDDEICISIKGILPDGGLDRDEHALGLNPGRLIVLGFNPNLRMLKLESHVLNSQDSDLMFAPLKHLIGDGKPAPVLTEILRPVPKSQDSLNEEQQKVGHPLRLKTAMEVAGPPGTGKTKTIVELVRALLECTDYDIVVLSERNGAINAIAEKFKEASMNVGKEKVVIKDPLLWLSLITYGSVGTVGEATKLFTLDEKLR